MKENEVVERDMEEKEQKEEGSYSFINEKVKERPINKRKLFKKTVITVCGAAIFGMVACITFLLLEPVISNWLYPEEITRVEFPEEEDEITPEELLTDENIEQGNGAEGQEPINQQEIVDQVAEEVSSGKLALQTYRNIYDELYQIAVEASAFVVTLTGVSQDTDWFQNQVENVNETSGVIVAKNEDNIYILADLNGLPDAETYNVTFGNGSRHEAQLKQDDPNTGLAIFTVPKTAMTNEEWEEIAVAKLGNSRTPAIVGRPIVALGSPLGQSGSVCYGIITSNKSEVIYTDYQYSVLTTDITGSINNASGVIINTSGDLLGIITKESSANASGALLAGFGISDIRTLLEQLSNGDRRLYLGIHVVDVTEEVHEDMGIPYGVYAMEVDSGSPAMTSGVVNGDVITRLGNKEIKNSRDYEEALQSMRAELTVAIEIKRFDGEKYVTIEGEIKPEELR